MAEDISQVTEAAAHPLVIETFLAIAIVDLPFLCVAENVVRLTDRLEALLSLRVIGVSVGVQL